MLFRSFVIDRWKECVKYLDSYDCVGQTWLVLGDTIWGNGEITKNVDNVGHYPGNFWWSNASYINRLDHNCLETSYRLDREFWIGTGKNYKSKSLEYWPDDFSSKLCGGNLDLTQYYFSEKNYIK